MSRADKLHKLANAIRDYRGAFHADTGVWIRGPKYAAASRVIRWLESLGINTNEGLKAIRDFRTLDEFRAWFRKL